MSNHLGHPVLKLKQLNKPSLLELTRLVILTTIIMAKQYYDLV